MGLVVAAVDSDAQNLVPNGSFEMYSNCPDALGQLEQAIGWSSFCGTPDYFNACADTLIVDVPGNGFGYQHASEGQAYIGCYTYRTGQVGREQLQAQLSAALVPGQLTYLSMKVATGGFGFAPKEGLNMRFASSGIGMRFSMQPLALGPNLSNTAMLYMEDALQDTADWTILTGTFVPDSAYTHVQIGNFFVDSLCEIALLEPDAMIEGAYAFVDELCVSISPGVCDDHSSVMDIPRGGWSFSARVVGDELWLSAEADSQSSNRFVLLDAMGHTCWTAILPARGRICTVSMAPFANGAYCICAITNSGVQQVQRFMFLTP